VTCDARKHVAGEPPHAWFQTPEWQTLPRGVVGARVSAPAERRCLQRCPIAMARQRRQWMPPRNLWPLTWCWPASSTPTRLPMTKIVMPPNPWLGGATCLWRWRRPLGWRRLMLPPLRLMLLQRRRLCRRKGWGTRGDLERRRCGLRRRLRCGHKRSYPSFAWRWLQSRGRFSLAAAAGLIAQLLEPFPKLTQAAGNTGSASGHVAARLSHLRGIWLRPCCPDRRRRAACRWRPRLERRLLGADDF